MKNLEESSRRDPIMIDVLANNLVDNIKAVVRANDFKFAVELNKYENLVNDAGKKLESIFRK